MKINDCLSILADHELDHKGKGAALVKLTLDSAVPVKVMFSGHKYNPRHYFVLESRDIHNKRVIFASYKDGETVAAFFADRVGFYYENDEIVIVPDPYLYYLEE